MNRRSPYRAVAWVIGVVAGTTVGVFLARLCAVGMTQTYDTMLYGRSLWGIGHGESLNPVYGMHWAGIHANLVLYPLAPFTHVAPAWLVLTIAQAVAFGAFAALVCRAAADAVAADGASRVLAVVWGLIAVVLAPLAVNPFFFDARPDLIAVPLLTAAMLRADRRNGWDGAAVALLVIAALVREEFAIVGAAAVLGFVRRGDAAGRVEKTWRFPQRLVAALGLLGWFAGYWWLVRPAFGDGFAAGRADQAASDLFLAGSDDAGTFRALFVVSLVTFGGGLVLGGRRWLLAAVPGVAFVAATTKLADFALNFHYAMFAAPALATASIAGLRDAAAKFRDRPKSINGLLVATTLVGVAATLTLGAHPGGRRFQAEYFGTDPESASWLAECHALLERVGDDDGVAVAPMFGAPFADRVDVWSLETLTARLANGGDVPPEVRWIAVDNNRFGGLGRVLVNRQGFQLVGIAAGRLGLFERPPDPRRQPPILATEGLPASCRSVAASWPDVAITLCDVRVEEERMVGVLIRHAEAQPTPPLAVSVEVGGASTVLEVLFGLVDPATIAPGTAARVRSRDRIRSPEVRVHLQDLTGRSYPGVGPAGGAPTLGVPLSLPASAEPAR